MGLLKTESVSLTTHLVSDSRITPTTSGEIFSNLDRAQDGDAQDVETGCSPDSSMVSAKRKGLKVAFKVSPRSSTGGPVRVNFSSTLTSNHVHVGFSL